MTPIRRIGDHASFHARLNARRILDVAMALAGVALILLGGHALLDLVGGALTLIGIGLLLHDLRAARRRQCDLRVVANAEFDATLAAAALPHGYVREEACGASYITSPAVNAALEAASTPIELLPGRYAVPARIEEYRARSVNLHRPDFNQPKLGLRTDLDPALLDGGSPVRIQRTDYFSGVATNEMARRQFEELGAGRVGLPSLDYAVADLMVAGGALIGLADSKLSNHIGVTSLLITADDRIVLQEQGEQMIDAMRISLGASGSADLADLPTKDATVTLQATLRRAIEREAAEEVSAAVGPGRSATILTGYARFIDRGGKPEFFAITRTASRLAELRASAGERRYVHRIFDRRFSGETDGRGLLAEIDRLLDGEGLGSHRPSLSMTVCLRLARDHVSRAGLPPAIGG